MPVFLLFSPLQSHKQPENDSDVNINQELSPACETKSSAVCKAKFCSLILSLFCLPRGPQGIWFPSVPASSRWNDPASSPRVRLGFLPHTSFLTFGELEISSAFPGLCQISAQSNRMALCISAFLDIMWLVSILRTVAVFCKSLKNGRNWWKGSGQGKSLRPLPPWADGPPTIVGLGSEEGPSLAFPKPFLKPTCTDSQVKEAPPAIASFPQAFPRGKYFLMFHRQGRNARCWGHSRPLVCLYIRETDPGYMCKRAKSQHWENITNAGSGKTGSLTASVNVEKRSRGMKARANKSCALRWVLKLHWVNIEFRGSQSLFSISRVGRVATGMKLTEWKLAALTRQLLSDAESSVLWTEHQGAEIGGLRGSPSWTIL